METWQFGSEASVKEWAVGLLSQLCTAHCGGIMMAGQKPKKFDVHSNKSEPINLPNLRARAETAYFLPLKLFKKLPITTYEKDEKHTQESQQKANCRCDWT